MRDLSQTSAETTEQDAPLTKLLHIIQYQHVFFMN